MAVIAAAVVAMLLAGADVGADGGSGSRPGAGRADAGIPAEARDAGGADAAGPALDPADEDLIRHLDEVERQELLEHLELFEEPDG